MSKRVLLACLVASALAAGPAAAFRPSSRWLLEQAMNKQIERAVRTLKVEQESTSPDATRPVVERILLSAPSNLRKESEVEGGLRVEIRADDKVTTKSPGQPDKTAKAPVDVLTDWLAAGQPLDKERAADRLVKDLKAMGVNTDVVSFARFDGKVAYLIGGKPWETDKPSVWVDKETLLLVRVVAIGKDKEGKPSTTDVRLLGWGSPEGGNWFPKTIETWVNGKLVKRSITRSVDKNVPMEAGLFDGRK
jgi:hypothetical protein